MKYRNEQGLLKESLEGYLYYDYELGQVINRIGRKGALEGRIAGEVLVSRGNKYRRICLNGVRILAHRAAWCLVHGKWPDGYVDHRNNDGLDNHIGNLRVVTTRQNNQNRRIHNEGRLCGASWHKPAGRWVAQITVNGVVKYLGLYDTEMEAHQVYLDAVRRLGEKPLEDL